jgi:membrane associated rhomboid family serine protease
LKLIHHLAGNVWTYVSAGFVLMTVTGSVRTTGIMLTVFGIAVECTAVLLKKEEPNEP